jgi:hypothetical protein
MPSRASLPVLALLLAGSQAAYSSSIHMVGAEPGSWPQILGSVGFAAGSPGKTEIFVVRAGEAAPHEDWPSKVERGAYLILEGASEVARSFGFEAGPGRVRVLSMEDVLSPRAGIVWERAEEVPVFRVPSEAAVLARERWTGAPLVAGLKRGAGGVLWVALPPGQRGYERFPYLFQALSKLGLSPPFRSNRLWAFFDSSYRTRADTEYLAERWRAAGIRGLHVAAWHFYEPEREMDAYLRGLIESCHQRGILVYAWLELPHVSEKFWTDHPAWREKTALLQDAHLDWRKLMNLADPDCFAAVSAGIGGLLARFDWDGVNLAELYFESLQGHENPSRFTPMNDDVRRRFRESHGFDPLDLFDAASPRHYTKDPRGLRQFLDFRAELSRNIQGQWLEALESVRRSKPDLDLVLTHLDDRFDPAMRDAVGADAAAVLPLLDRHSFTFLIEDPATVWSLGPERYREIAGKYAALTPHRDRLAIDLNIVERYQDVYPTKRQAGTELLQLVSQAARAFPRVALYFENSIQSADIPWLSAAAAAVERCERDGENLIVDSPYGAGIRWEGGALVDGRLWPAGDAETIWIPPGRHKVRPAAGSPAVRLVDLTGELVSAASLAGVLEFAYHSQARAYATLDTRPSQICVDGLPLQLPVMESRGRIVARLPRGRHQVRVEGPRKGQTGLGAAGH